MTLIDAGPLLALVSLRERDRHQTSAAAIRQVSRPIATTWPCMTEAMYLAFRTGGWQMQAVLWRYLAREMIRIVDLSEQDARRMRALMEQYREVPMDLADASLVAAAEALCVRSVLTLDSDFRIYRLADGSALDIVP